MAKSIRVMFYDKSKWAGEMLNKSWLVGGWLYKTVRRIDECVGVESWDEVFEWIEKMEPEKKISMLQFWGHGSSGEVWINKESLNSKIVRQGGKWHKKCLMLKSRLAPGAVIWLRACSIFSGIKGQKFARRWTTFFNCTVAAHTFIIGPLQSGLYTLKPNQEPYWPAEEGIDDKGKSTWSQLWAPRTITCLRGSIPKGW